MLLPAAVTNLCRDEVTAILKDKIESVWGGSFNVNGLGGVLTCGVTGFKAGLSHAPVCAVSGDWGLGGGRGAALGGWVIGDAMPLLCVYMWVHGWVGVE